MKKYKVLSPSCYRNFSCKGGDCRNTCCAGWAITMDAEEYKKTKKKKGNLDGLVVPMEQKEGKGKQYEMVLNEEQECPFWNEDKLCSLQLEFGSEILSAICRNFPRVYHRYKEIEGGLSLGCERVLELLLEEKGHLEFSSYDKNISENQKYQWAVSEKKLAKYPILKYYYQIKDLCVSLLQAEGTSLENRMLLLGIALHRIDGFVKENQTEKIPGYLELYFEQLEQMDLNEQLDQISAENVAVLYNNLLMAFSNRSSKKYGEFIDKIKEKMQMNVSCSSVSESAKLDGTLSCSTEVYFKGKENLKRFMAGREYFLENLLVAWLWNTNTPFRNLENGIWKDYSYFVWTYSMLKVVLTIMLDETSTESDMVDCCVTMFRHLGHNVKVYEQVLQDFEEHQTDSVAHMAFFLKS